MELSDNLQVCPIFNVLGLFDFLELDDEIDVLKDNKWTKRLLKKCKEVLDIKEVQSR